MSKTPTPKSEQVETAESTQPSVYDDLLKNGTAILEAQTREDLAELVDNIPADCKYCVGAVGCKAEGTYVLQINIINN